MMLNLHSYYSLRYGTLSIDRIVELLQANGYDTAVLTDINNSSAVLDFIKACQTAGIKGLAGMEFKDGDQIRYIAIARNVDGFREINELISRCNISGTAIPSHAPQFSDAYVVYPFGQCNPTDLLDNEYIGIKPSQLNKIAFENKRSLAKYVVWLPVTFSSEHEYALHYNLRAVNNNCLRTQLTASQVAGKDESICPKQVLRKKYEAYPEILTATQRLLEGCSFTMDFTENKNKKIFTATAYDDKLLLEKLAYEGMKFRYGISNKEAQRRIAHELEIIDRLGFSSYFLITWDIVRYTQSRNFYHIGRGSGANSIVAYCLKITDVCPIELDLYFERFLNPGRKTPPDFDLDFGHKERDEVFDYIFKRYGTKHTALMGAMSTFKDRSILRELGKAYGLPKGDIDRLVNEPYNVLNKTEVTDILCQLYSQVEDFPNLRTIHSSGVLISEQSITTYCALDMPPKGFQTAQIDMYTAEGIGFEKFDILSQRGISHIQECVELVQQTRGKRLNIFDFHKLKKNKKVQEQLCSGNTIGAFYGESPAMRQILKKLKCSDYISLVAATSIIRPGVAQSGMMKTYIERFHDPSKTEYLHPTMKDLLQETYGVMVYQEDVLKIGIHFFGLSAEDADFLRRMMSGKSRGMHHLEVIRDKAFSNCKTKGIPENIYKEVWRQLQSFAGYSFSKAHSAAFSVETIQSVYLLAHYPVEFYTAVLNNQGGFYRPWVYVNEALKYGATVELPCINHSDVQCTVLGKTIYLGFMFMKSLEFRYAERIANDRTINGIYTSLEDFIKRTQITLEQVLLLVRVGALRFTNKNKKELAWEAHTLLSEKPVPGNQLFETRVKAYSLPDFETTVIEDAYDELEILGFSRSTPLFTLLKTRQRGDVMANNLLDYVGKTVRMIGQYVTTKDVRTIHKEVMAFGTYIDVEGNFIDSVHFPQSLKAYPVRGAGLYLLKGKVVQDFGVPSVEVWQCAKLPIVEDPRIS